MALDYCPEGSYICRFQFPHWTAHPTCRWLAQHNVDFGTPGNSSTCILVSRNINRHSLYRCREQYQDRSSTSWPSIRVAKSPAWRDQVYQGKEREGLWPPTASHTLRTKTIVPPSRLQVSGKEIEKPPTNMADRLSQDLIRAEVDANQDRQDTLSTIATHGPDIERDWSPLSTSSHTVTPTYTVRSPASPRHALQLTWAQNATQATLHPLEIARISRSRTQHQLTVGSRPSNTRGRSTATITTLGAGKPVPPRDTAEGDVVEFDGVNDPEHPHNWPFRYKYVFPGLLDFHSVR
jgi:hypothetical protein